MAMTNAEKQAAFRQRRKEADEAHAQQVADLTRQLETEKATSAELRRRLEALAGVIANQQESLTLFEVIASGRKPNADAYGITFTAEAEANTYATAMQAAGYEVDPYPAYSPTATAQQALAEAGRHFGDLRLQREATQ